MSRQVPHVEDIATGTPTSGLVPVSAGPGLAPAWGVWSGGSNLTVIPLVIREGGSVLSAVSYEAYFNWGYHIEDWILAADQPGDVSVELAVATYSAFPTFTTISGSTPPALSSQQKNRASVWTGWTRDVAADRFLRWTLSGVDTITGLGIYLLVTRAS
jgi:hypothetical protein